MAICVLRVFGTNFAVDKFLADSCLRPSNVWHKGEPRHNGTHEDSGLIIEISEGSWEGLQEQTKGAVAFLNENQTELRRLMESPGVDGGTLDFAISKRKVVAQFDRFPADVVRLAGALGLCIELSQYPLRQRGGAGKRQRGSRHIDRRPTRTSRRTR